MLLLLNEADFGLLVTKLSSRNHIVFHSEEVSMDAVSHNIKLYHAVTACARTLMVKSIGKSFKYDLYIYDNTSSQVEVRCFFGSFGVLWS